ncbi:alpha/beta hydrolase [Saccharibacillus sp. JS10]|uniref:alpha/beta hydrolase n=1 Tax=Saccharibacillus sp. JS10 TaxID=2950552 RepID=UPI0021091F27|nr:alpha/beta hydrolase [Saccharibacillus sp. JS10]MCQ4086819.1 lysophospholipase [Saccharibacillus sp. JS10]
MNLNRFTMKSTASSSRPAFKRSTRHRVLPTIRKDLLRNKHPYFFVKGTNEVMVCVHAWSIPSPKAIVQISHGMGENGARYAALAEELNKAGYAVYANDHRGHGFTKGDTPQGPFRQGYAGPDAINGMCRDLRTVTDEIAQRHPNVPIVLFGHSMGSFIAQKTMAEHAANYAGFILTGSSGPRSALPLKIGSALAAAEARVLSPAFASLTLNMLVFGPFVRRFAQRRTFFDWLSRDPQSVDDFIENYGQTLFSCGFFRDFFRLLLEIQTPHYARRLDVSKPVLLCSGELDPVGGAEGLAKLKDFYEEAGIDDLECRLYPEARHELAFEINRSEVTEDWISWLERHFS